MKFVIWTWDYNKHVGGVRVLHKLCDTLNSLGQEAYVTCEITNPEFDTPKIDVGNIDFENTVVIYPECIYDNPLGAKHVVRWLLWNAVEKYSSETDYIFKILPDIKYITDQCDGILTLMDFNLKFWNNLNDGDRPQNMILLRKMRNFVVESQVQFVTNKIFYDDLPEDEHLIRDEMNKSTHFVSFDYSSYCSLQAAMCGCISLVVPNSMFTLEEWHKKFPGFKYGVAYGIDRIPHAKETMHLVKPHLEEMQKNNLVTVHNFIKFWEDKLCKN